MTSTINASTTAGIVTTADTSGVLALQTAGTTAVTIDASQRAAFVAGTAALPAITTTGDTNTGIFFPAADTIAFSEGGVEAARIDSSGNLLVGRTSTIGAVNKEITVSAASGGAGFCLQDVGVSSKFQLIAGATGANAFGLYDLSASAYRMIIDSSGNVGIGTTSPADKLDIVVSSSSTNPVFGGTSNNGIRLQNSNATAGNFASILNVNSAGTLSSLIAFRNVDHSTPNTAGAIDFVTRNGGTLYRAMTVSQDGNLLVGTTSTTINTTNFGAYVAQDGGIFASRNVDGSVVAFYFGGNAGAFRVLGNGNAQNTNNSYGAISDVKLKENIVDATPKLADLMQVKVRNYNLIGSTTKQIGVVAQELETIFPAMIDESPDKDEEGNELSTKTKAVKYSVFVPMLIKAMQEQQALITQLQADVAALKGA